MPVTPGVATASTTTARVSFERSLTTWDREAAETPAGPAYVPEIGDTVKHDKFGEGVVMKCEEWGSDFEVSVCFDGGELRRLLLSFARLEKVAD